MIEIHQALFGEGADLGHSLLNSSFSNDIVPNQLAGYTDLVDRPQEAALQHPIIRGMIIKDVFMFVKSFPDLEGRPGRVFSHALILKKSDYLQLHDVTDLIQFFLEKPVKNSLLQVISYPNLSLSLSSPSTERELVAVQGMIDHLDHNNTIVWMGETGYWDWISKVWRRLPEAVKSIVKIGSAFNTRYVDKNAFNLIVISENYKSNWLRERFFVVDNTNINIVETDLHKYILGHNERDSSLEKMLQDFDATLMEIDDLRVLNKYAKMYANLDDKSKFKDVLMLSGLISRYSRSSASGILAKHKIISQIGVIIPNCQSAEILLLDNQTWDGIPANLLDSEINVPAKNWLKKNLLMGNPTKDKSAIASKALVSKKKTWWQSLVVDYIEAQVKSWGLNYSSFVWDWIIQDNSVLGILLSKINDNAEMDLESAIPEVDKKTAELILPFLLTKKWYFLYGKIVLRTTSSADAFRSIIRLTARLDGDRVINHLSKEVVDEQIVADAIAIDHEVLEKIAVSRILQKPALKNKLTFNNLQSQKIWVLAAQQGSELWLGINNPQQVLYILMDNVIAENNVTSELLEAISISEYSSLKSYSKRDQIWSCIKGGNKNAFLHATVVDILLEGNSHEELLRSAEQPIRDYLNNQINIQQLIDDSRLSISSKLGLIFTSPFVQERNVIAFCSVNLLTEFDSLALGQFIARKVWKDAAHKLYDLRHRSDLKPALKQCIGLLGFWERLFLPKDYGETIVSTDEFWQMLLVKTIDHYPDGPNQNGLWENAGGKRSDLHTHGSGKEIWGRAISHMKSGGKPHVRNLVKKMNEEFPYDDSLKHLIKLI